MSLSFRALGEDYGYLGERNVYIPDSLVNLLKMACDINENAEETALPTVNQIIPKELSSAALTASTASTNSSTLSPEPGNLDNLTQNDMNESDAAAKEDVVGNVNEECIDKLMAKADKTARDKAKQLVKKKLDLKLKNMEISDAIYKELEEELIEDMEETIQEELARYREYLRRP